MGKFILKRGLKNLYAAEVTADTESTLTYGTPFKLTAAGEMTRTVDSEKLDVWFDDTVFDTFGKENATEISITGAALRAEDIAKLTGKHVDSTTGGVIDSGAFAPKYYALIGQTEATDGTIQYFSFLKGTFAIPDENDKTKDDTTDYNGMTLTFSAIRTVHEFTIGTATDACKAVHADTASSHLKALTGGTGTADWFAQVVTPDNIGTIIEKNT